MQTSLIGAMRHGIAFMKIVAMIVLVTFGSLVISPTVMAAKAELERQERTRPAPVSDEARVAESLTEIKELLASFKQDTGHAVEAAGNGPGLGDKIAVAAPPKTFFDDDKTKRRLARLKSLRQSLLDMHDGARARFDETERHIKANNLSPVILERHTKAVRQYQQEMARLIGHLEAVETAQGEAAVQAAIDSAYQQMKGKRQKRSHQFTDPNDLPFGPSKASVREPLTSKEDLQALVSEPVMVASADDGQPLMLAALAPNPAPAAADLAETEDVQITQAIRELAAELDHQPVKIYNWVHNNIEYLPTYGSIQGSHMTLQTKRGNAFDTASLLIALLRASDIPARYAYGTVRVPAEKVMNWVGGVGVPEAAMNLMAQGGIPNKGLAQGGVVKWIQLEHVWVEAWLDMIPSRGAVQRAGDSWAMLDASFKQYDYTEGMRVQQAVPFDAQAFADELQQSATINETEGWVQGIDQALIQQRLGDYQAQIEAFVSGQNPEATVGDVLGTKTIIQRTSGVLGSHLPYEHIVTTDGFASLPQSLRWKFQYSLQDEWGGELFTFADSLPRLAGRQLALSFRPATQADADLIASYLPEPPADGSPIDPASLPSSLPGYLINLVPEWTVDGQVRATGPAVTMGHEVKSQRGYWRPASGWALRQKVVTAGQYQALGLDPAGLGAAQLSALQAQLEATKTQLEAQDLGGLSKHDLTGAILQSGVLLYFAMNDLQDQLTARAAGAVAHRLPSHGAFETTLTTDYWFGLPRTTRFSGVTMDIDHLHFMLVADDNDSAAFRAIARASGSRASALEHLVPEQLFATAEAPVEGVSAVKALALAAAQGQRIYSLTSANSAQLANVSIDSGARAEIQAALAAGKEVTVHAAPITHYGWQGSGYTLIDPETGAGAYKISGGADGGVLVGGVAILGVGLIALMGAIAGAPIAPILIAAILALALHIVVLELLFNDNVSWDQVKPQILTIIGFVAGFYFGLPATIKTVVGLVIAEFLALWSLT